MTDEQPSEAALLSCAVACFVAPPGWSQELSAPVGTTAAELVALSDLMKALPQVDAASCPLAVFGELVARDYVLQPYDRVEVMVHAAVDPKQARRDRAQAG